jgi:hypothetical protein
MGRAPATGTPIEYEVHEFLSLTFNLPALG